MNTEGLKGPARLCDEFGIREVPLHLGEGLSLAQTIFWGKPVHYVRMACHACSFLEKPETCHQPARSKQKPLTMISCTSNDRFLRSDPVATVDGCAYERDYIERRFAT